MNKIAYYEDREDRLVVVNANTEKRNALSSEYYQTLEEAMKFANETNRIKSVILQGKGGFFCSGGDLTMIKQRTTLPLQERVSSIGNLNRVMDSIYQCSKPVIAAIQGGAAGAGVSLTFACDFIIAEDDAKFTVAYVKAGLVPDGGLTSLLKANISRIQLMRMAMLGEPIDSMRLYQLGAISELVEKGNAIDAADALADKLAKGPSASQGVIKNLVNQAAYNSFKNQMQLETDAMANAVGSEEAKEGINAFLRKEKPDFNRVNNDIKN